MNERPIVNMAIAEDQEVVRAGIIGLIQNMKGGIEFRVSIDAANGKELLGKIASAIFQPQLILLDIRMPEMDGYETMLNLHKQYPFVQVLIFTSIDAHTELSVLRMLKLGARGYFIKNDSPAELEKALTDVSKGGIYLPSGIRRKLPGINERNMKEYLKKLFTDRQILFISLCCSDLTYRQIGEKMEIEERSAQHYAEKLAERLDIHSKETRVALALCAIRAGLCSL